MEKMQTAILGASGYTGAETVRLALTHPHLDIRALTAHRYAGNAYGDVFPHMSAHGLPRLEKWDDVNWDQIDVIFACLPHGASEETVAKLAGGRRKIIDLSADFRLKDAAVYAENYGRAHGSPDLLSRAVYGLTEFARDDIKAADLIACPGCYPTASLLALLPALTFIEPDDITIDAKSGVSGAGRKDSLAFGYSEVAEGAHAYGIGSHRHGPEIDEKLSLAVGGKIEVGFTPHLVPMNRGMIATCYVKLKDGASAADLRTAFERRYDAEPFVHVLPEGQVPHTRHVRGSNQCRIGIFSGRRAGRAIIVSVIDNLAKGSSGQAMQNLNVMMGWDEALGLEGAPLFP